MIISSWLLKRVIRIKMTATRKEKRSNKITKLF